VDDAGVSAPGIDQFDREILKMARVARRDLGASSQGDPGDLGIAELTRPTLTLPASGETRLFPRGCIVEK
jgi:hypothetical protein